MLLVSNLLACPVAGPEEGQGPAAVLQAGQVRRWQAEEEGDAVSPTRSSLRYSQGGRDGCISSGGSHGVLRVCWFLQKWSKGKQKEKVNNAVLFDQATYDKLLSEVPKYKQITPSVLSERLRVNPSFQICTVCVRTCLYDRDHG